MGIRVAGGPSPGGRPSSRDPSPRYTREFQLRNAGLEDALNATAADGRHASAAHQDFGQQAAAPLAVATEAGILGTTAGQRDYGVPLAGADPPRPTGSLGIVQARHPAGAHPPHPLADGLSAAAQRPGRTRDRAPVRHHEHQEGAKRELLAATGTPEDGLQVGAVSRVDVELARMHARRW